jgi:hypothetical protein
MIQLENNLSSLHEIQKYIDDNFEFDSCGKLVPKIKGPDVIIIDYINLLKHENTIKG